MKPFASASLTLLGALVLSGCAVGPTYQKPRLPFLPASWQHSPPTAPLAPNLTQLAWWEDLNDPTLNELIKTALINNDDLKIAAARLQEARANRQSAVAALLPQINANTAGKRGNTGVGTTDQVASSFDANFDASWELDLFGGGRRAAEAAQATVESRAAAVKQVRISLIGELVRTYADFRRLQEVERLTSANLQAQTETLSIVKAQMREGIASQLDVARIEAQTALTHARLPEIATQLISTQNNLAVLCGLTPAEIPALLVTSTVPTISPTMLFTTPASAIAARPDIQVAERELAAATANQGVALSNWFPKLTLTGLFGLQDTLPLSTIDVWNAGGTIRLPLLDFGRVSALVKQADARQAIAFATYQQTIKTALAEIESNLAGFTHAQQQLAMLTQAAAASQKAENLARIHFREGLGSLLDVLVAQRERLDTENSLADTKATLVQRYAGLYKALGGGTEVSQTALRSKQ